MVDLSGGSKPTIIHAIADVLGDKAYGAKSTCAHIQSEGSNYAIQHKSNAPDHRFCIWIFQTSHGIISQKLFDS